MERRLALAAATVAALWLPAAAAEKPSATVTIARVNIAFLVSGNVGGGTLSFGGKSYDFTIGGLGYGGVGASRVEATGEVYNLTRIEDFEGPYAQGRAGAVAGSQQVEGGMWLINPNGVQMHLRSRREGYALSLGGDAVYVMFD
jgi:hypothetical protein